MLVERKLIDEIADVIITHWPYDIVTAHANTTQMVLQALDAVSAIRATSPVSMHHVKQIFYHTALGSMNVHENLFPRIPTTVIDISDVATVKQRAMNKFRSQYFSESNPNQWRKIAESVDGAGASFARVAYAESFVAQYPQACDYMPVPETSLYSAGKSYEAMFEDQFQFLLGR